MTRRRASLATLVAAVALLFGTAGPAAAAEDLTVDITSPPDGEVLTDPNAVIAGTATTDALHVVKGVRVTVTSRLNAENHSSCDAPVAPDGSFSCSPGFRVNGPYEAVVTATDALHLDLGDVRTREATRGFKMEAPPAPPQGVTVDVGPDRRATISWVRNTEPDLRHYVVTRVAPDGGTSAVGFVPQPPSGERVSLVDGSLPPAGGKYEYIVAAVRSDRDGQATNNRAVAGSAPYAVEIGAAPTAGAGPPGLPSRGARRGSNVSSFLRPGGGAPTSLALPDGATLPVDDGGSSGQPFALPGGDGSESADPAVLEGGPSTSNQRALVVPIAAVLLLCVLAFHLRQFDRTVLAAPPAYHPIVESDSDPGERRDADDDHHGDSETGALVGAGRPRGQG
jgi:hypothetical protein